MIGMDPRCLGLSGKTLGKHPESITFFCLLSKKMTYFVWKKVSKKKVCGYFVGFVGFCCSNISKDMLCGMGLSKVKFTGSIIFLWTIRRACGVVEIYTNVQEQSIAKVQKCLVARTDFAGTPAIDGSNTMFLQHFLTGSAKLLRYRMLSEVRSCIQLTYDIFSVARTSNTSNSLGTKHGPSNLRHTV